MTGDASVTAIIARFEGEDLQFLSNAEDAAMPDRGFVGRLDEGPHPVEPPD